MNLKEQSGFELMIVRIYLLVVMAKLMEVIRLSLEKKWKITTKDAEMTGLNLILDHTLLH